MYTYIHITTNNIFYTYIEVKYYKVLSKVISIFMLFVFNIFYMRKCLLKLNNIHFLPFVEFLTEYIRNEITEAAFNFCIITFIIYLTYKL